MNFALHIPTIYLTGAILLTLAGLLLGRSVRKAPEPFLACSVAYCAVVAVGNFIFALRGIIPDVVVVVGANSMVILGSSFLWFSLRMLNGRKSGVWMVGVLPGIWLLACLFPAFHEMTAVRVLLASLIHTAVALCIAWEARRAWRAMNLRAALDLAWMSLAGALIIFSRVPSGMFPSLGGLEELPLMLVIALGTILPFLTLAIAREHAAAQWVLQEEAAQSAGRAEVARLHGALPALIFLRALDARGNSRLLYRGGDIEAVLGWPADTFAGHNDLAEWMDPAEPSAIVRYQQAVEHGEHRAEFRFRQPDGSWRWLRSNYRCLSREADGSAEVVGYTVNISAERSAEARAISAARLSSLGEMATGLAHELNQPLAVMALAADVTALRLTNHGERAIPGALSQLGIIAANAVRARDIVDHLRLFGRSEETPIPPEPIVLHDVVQGTLTLSQAALRERGVRVLVDLPQELPPVLGRQVPLEQVLMNLIVNARDAIEETGQGNGCIRLAAQHAGAHVRLTVSDNGGGIPAAAMERLFEPFFTTKAAGKGTGLGLSLAYQTMQSMGGEITAHNGPEGAVFTLTLPVTDRGTRLDPTEFSASVR